ncbi:P27 family phage terminase small subunit [Shinella sp. BYT-45]|uniref:P27 family phage terminase small subunit n=1 Tax=Shinella sp. BYT-45 TaxID=3377377 RepID=UPI00397F2288
MDVIDGSGSIVPEPNWGLLLTDELEVESAREYWRLVTTEMRERNILSPINRHSIQRLIMAYVMFDRTSRTVAEQGPVLKPKRGNPKSIARMNPHYTAMREAGADADRIEAELGLSPRRRNAAGKIEKKAKVSRASDAYLKPVSK